MVNQLVLVLYKHRQLGWRFNLYLAEKFTDHTVQLSGPPDAAYIRQPHLTDDERALLRLMEDASEKSLMKKYSKEKVVVDFLKNLKEETLEKFIRPAIEIYSARIVALARKTGIPLYLREEMKRTTLFSEQQIHILPANTQCLFNFVRDDTGLRYFITLTNEQIEISLKGKPEILVTNKPAIVISDNLLHLVDDIEAKRLIPFFTKDFITVPPAMEQKYMQDFVLKTFLQYKTKMQGIALVYTNPEKQAILSLEEDFNNRLHLLLTFLYDTRRVIPGSAKKITASLDETDPFRINWYERDFDWEKSLVQKLTVAGLRAEGENRFYESVSKEDNPLGLIEWINTHQQVLKSFVFEQNTGNIYYTKDIVIRSKLNAQIDWFDVHIEVVAGDYTLPFSRFRKHILTGIREYVLPDHSILVLPEEWFEKYQELFLHGEKEGNLIRLKKLHFSLVDKLFNKTKKEELPEWRSHPVRAAIPPALVQVLRPYQKEGFYWLLYLYHNRFGGCLADDMGLGKTLQTITLLEFLYANAGKKKMPSAGGQLSLFDADVQPQLPASLIVVPTSLLHNWRNEIRRFAPDMKVYLYAGNNRLKTKDIGRVFDHYQIVISSYGTVRNDLEYFRDYRFHYLILDESQYIKNADSQTYKAVKQIQADYRLVLTGTPIENSLNDLWSQFNFINEGLLGNFSSFQKAYIQPIVKQENKEIEERLQRLIRPFLLRRTKEEVTPELPPLLVETVYCDMSEEQQVVYDKEKNLLRNSLLENTETKEKNQFVALQGLMRLRLLSNHPALINSAYTGDSGKYNQILLSFESLKAGGHKVLIFSSFVKHLKLIAKAFDEQGWKYAMLTGQTHNRQSEIEKFTNRSDVHCFFISLKAGGVGLNLTAADYVFIIDPWWNPAAEMQALSRAHRIGQDKNVMVSRFISTDTIEEKILRLQEKKTELSETFITSANLIDYLTTEEIQKLLS